MADLSRARRGRPRRPVKQSFGAVASVGLGLFAVSLLSCARSSSEPAIARPSLVVGGLGGDAGRFRFPRAVAVAPDGGFYVVDRTGRIQLFTSDGDLVTAWETPEHEFGQPVGLAVEASGDLLVSDSHYHRVLRYSASGSGPLLEWGRKGTGPGEMTFGRDLTIDREGRVYVGDYGGTNDRVQQFASDGTWLLSWGQQGSAPGEFDRIQGMTIERVDDGERLLVADCCNHRIQRFRLDGSLVDVWGTLGTGPGELRYPSSVAQLSDGTILVSEWGNNRVQRFSAAGEPLGILGRAGREPGEFATPWDVEVGPDDRIFVVDYGNHRVQVFSPADIVPVTRGVSEGSPPGLLGGVHR